MSKHKDREEFLGLETGGGALPTEEYTRLLAELKETTLTRPQRSAWTTVAAAAFILAARCAALAAVWPATASERLFWALIAGIAFLWSWHGASILRAGRIVTRTHRTKQACLIACTLFLFFFFLTREGCRLTDPAGLTLGFVLLAAGLVILVVWRIDVNALSTREELLRLQLQVAQLCDKIDSLKN